MSSPVPSLNNDLPLGASGVAELEDMDQMMDSDNKGDSSVLVQNSLSSPADTSSAQALESARTNLTLQVRRTAHCHSLNPYATSELNHFASEVNASRQLLTYGLLLSIRHHIGVLASPTGAYVVPKPLMVGHCSFPFCRTVPMDQIHNLFQDNLKDYAIASLLSPKLSTYKGALPSQRVLVCILSYILSDGLCH
jgi:hypothetical protein